MALTITEALAEIKTISSRLDKKRKFVLQHATRSENLKDPMEKDGGSLTVLRAERQSISGLETRIVRLRSAINSSNQSTKLTLGGETRTVADWLIWRREVMPAYRKFLVDLNKNVEDERKNFNYSRSHEDKSDVVVNIDLKSLNKEAETLEEILGGLDGQLSLLNATTTIEIE